MTAAVPDGGDLPAKSASVDRVLAGLFGRDAMYMVLWAGQLIAAAIVTPVVTRLMVREQFGLLASANAVMQILFVVGGAGLATAIQHQYAVGSRVDARKLLAVATAAALLAGLVAHITGDLWSRALGFDGYGPLLKLTVLWAVSGAITNCVLAMLRSQDRLLRFALVGGVQSVVAEVASLALVAGGDSSEAQLFVLGQVLAQVLAMVIGFGFVLPALPRRGDLAVVTRGLRFALPLVPTALSAFVLAASDRLILQRVLGADAVGGYQIAYNVASMPMLLLFVLNTAWLPRLFGVVSEQAAVLAASRDAVNMLLPPTVFGMAVGGPIVLRVWAPSTYGPDALAMTLAVVVVSLIPYAAGLAATRTLMMHERTATVAVCNILAAVLNVTLNLVLVPKFQLIGAAVATLIAFTALWGALLLVSKHVLVVERSSWPIVATLGLSGVAAVGSATVPVSGGFFVARLGVAVLALCWLAGVVLHIHARARVASIGDAGQATA